MNHCPFWNWMVSLNLMAAANNILLTFGRNYKQEGIKREKIAQSQIERDV